MNKKVFLFYFLIAFLLKASSQCPTTIIAVEDTVCAQQNLILQNLSTGGTENLWDFCAMDLSKSYVSENSISTGGGSPRGAAFVQSGSDWYGFVTVRNNKNLLRLSFGSSLSNTPSVVNLGNPGGLFELVDQIELYREGDQWYGLVVNDQGSNNLIRLSFGSSLTGTPTAENLGNFGGVLNRPRGIAIREDDGDVIVGVTNFGSRTVAMLNFGSSISSALGSITYLESGVIPGDQIIDLEIGKDCDSWYGFVGSRATVDKVYRLSFGQSLYSVPLIAEVVSFRDAVEDVFELSLVHDGFDWRLFGAGQTSDFMRGDFGGDLSSSPAIEPVSLGITGPTSLEFPEGSGVGMILDYSTGQLKRLNYGYSCSLSERYSQEETPLNVNYEVSGWHYITLKVTDASSNVAYSVDSVYVKSAVTPPVEFSIDESRCISNTNVFTSIEDVSISSYEWDLGGGSFGEGDIDTSYQYPSSGAYEVRLRVGSENGCENTSTQTIHIYDSPPAPVVNAPDPICMASEILFDNSTDTTGFGSGGLQWNWWLWSLPSDTVHTYQYSHEFMSSGNDTLYVQAYVPGCTTQLEIPFEVIEVSLTYRYSQNCYGEATLFEGVVDSPESVDSVHWDFGDGFESTDGLMVSHQYGAKGSYPLQLYVRNINGCTTVIDTIFEVQDSVLVSIDSMDVIENIPVSITSSDLTLETDSIIQYRWYINGVESSDQWAFERSFPAGSVDLSLSVLTAQGCSDSVVYSFTVEEALCPTAAINVSDTVCLQQNLELLNSSVNGGAGYQWDFCGLRLSDSYTVESSMSTGGGSPRGASFGKSGDSWYGFVTVRDNKNLLRLSFGSSLSNTPSVVNLGNPGGLFELVDQIELYREGDQWYGLVVNDQGSNNLIRLSFGSSLTGTPTAENLGNFGGVLNRPRGIAIREDDGDVIVGVTNFGSRTVAMLNFGSSISSALGSITYLESGVIPGDQIIDLEIGKDCDSWYGFVGSRATVDKVYRLSFGQSLYSVPLIAEVVSFRDAVEDVFELSLVHDGFDWRLFGAGQTSDFMRGDFGGDLSSSPAIEPVSLGITGPTSLEFPEGSGVGMILDYSTGQLKRLNYGYSCSLSERYSQEETPLNVNYEVSGWHYITLKVTDASSNVAYAVDSVYVKSAVTPPVEFSIDESRCISNTNVFTSIEDVSISSYEWDLGGGSFGEGDIDTSYQYPSSGAYEVRLRVGSENGCENTSTQTIHIYDSPPAPVVNAPDPICMASEILFDNSTDTTGFGSGGLQWNWWLWSLPSDTVHTYQYSHEFMSSGNDTLYVQAYVPGCTTQLEIPFEVIEVSLTYRYSQNCYGEATLFEGVVDSPESVDSVHWDFGDGFESTGGLMVSHQYGAKGSYPLQLYVRNINGCTTVIDTIFEVQDSVLVSIDSMDVIENIPVSITSSDLTLETDSIIQYRWYINGVESSDQWAFERSFPAGSVDLSLSVLTAQGCSDSVVYSFTVEEALCPTAAINVSDTVCLQQNLELLNSSVNGGAGYQWDFCGLRLSDSYTVESSMSTGGGSPRGASFGKSGDSWYGFVTVRDNKNLLRLSFGSSLSNTPSVVNLGNPGGLFELVDQIELYREGDQWYGLVVNDQGSNNLIRLSFGSSLTGTPTAENLGNFGGVLNRPRGIAIREDDGDVIVGVTNFGSRTVAMLNFGSSISSALGSITYLESGVIPGDQIIDLEIGKDCDSWYGFVGSRATVDKVYRLSFGQSLYSVPLIAEVVSFRDAVEDVFELSLVHDGFDWRLFGAGQTSDFMRGDFGGDLSSSPAIEPVSLGITGPTSLEFPEGSGVGMILDYSTGQLKRLNYGYSCSLSERYSQEETPLNVNYEVSGWHYITLKVTDASSNVAYAVDSVYVKSAVTPPVEFSIDESRCISNTNVFTSIEDVSISSYEWDLGGGSFGEGDIDTSYQYPSSGAYEVRLRVGSENGCENTSTQTIHIYDSPPAPVVNAPDPICMASEILFDNSTDTTGFGSGGLQWNWWLWSLPSDTVHTYQYSHEFMSSGNDTLYVQAYVPGCTTQLEIPFEVIEVSLTYRYSQNCYGEATLFEGVVDSPESVDSVHWDFGDGFESTGGLMVSHQYGAKGSYPLQLYVRNINGCTTVIDTIFEVQDSVLVSIDSMDVIENIPVSITSSDLTLETDSIIQYRWYINGVESSDQWAFERSFPAGSVDLSLSVLTAQGCSDSVVYSFTVEEALCPTAAINVSDTVCLQQNLELLNSSVNGGAGYQWDFCGLRLSDSYTVESSMSTGGGSPRGASFGKSGDSWYGFVTVRDNKNLLRLSFGSSLSNTPSVVNLGNPGGLFELVDQIELYREGDQWYGLVVNDQGSNNLIRLSFGSSLTGTPTAENLGNFGGVLNRPRGIAIREDDGDVIVGVTNFGSRTVAMLNFGSSISSALGSITYLESGVIPGDQIIDLEIGKDCDSWYGFVGSRATVDKVYRLSFGQSLYSVPLIAEVVSFRDAVEDVFELSLVHDGFDWRLFGAGQTSDFMRGDFGGDLSSSPAIEPVSLGITGPTSLEFPEGSGVGMILDYSTGQLKRLNYGYSCSLSERYSQEETPLNVNYEVSGWHYITLKVTDASSNVAYAVDSVYVKELISPDISFTVDESRCIAHANTFTSESSTLENIVSYSWDFDGDGIEDSSEPNPTYQFSSAGKYTVILTIGDDSSCGNTARQTITVYAGPPSPDFSVDQTAYCAGEDVTLTNLSDDAAYGEGLTYHWSTELGDTTSTAPVFNFDQSGEKTISLYSSIPGCDSEILTKTVSILALPEIVFQADTACHGEFTEFTNLSEGTSFAWTFGDGFTSNAKSPEHFYTEPGLYEVAISNIDENGCENFLAKQVIVGAIPEAEFEYDIACQGDETILSDVSIVNGADIVEWEWYIEDTPVSQDKNPGVYFDREGSQTVTMTVVSSNGCTASYSESIDVLGQPQVDFSVERACQGDFTSFVDQTTNPDQIISRTWQINGETQTSDNDTLNYAFVEPGIYEVSLMVNNRSLCTAEQTKTIEILALPELDFLIDGVCENELITVLDQSVAINDAIVSRRWLLNGTFIGNGSRIEIPADVSGLHDVTLEVVTAFGCSLSRTETIEVYARPEVAFTPANDFGVPPFSLVFENETINGQSYKWYINGDLSSEEMTPSLSFGAEGLQTVKLVATNENGCMDSLGTQIESILPVVDLVVNEIQLIEDRGLQKILLDVSNKSNLPVELFEVQITLENEFTLSENVTRRINKGKDAVIGLSVSLPSISNLGYLCVSLVAPYNVPDQIPENNEGCINLESRTIFEPAFPNPATDVTHIRMILPLDGDVELTILDLSGQVKQQKTLPNRPSGLTTFTIDLQTLQSGTYFIAIKYNGGSHRTRVIKQ